MSGLGRTRPLDPAAVFTPLHDFKRIALAVSGGPDSLALMLLADAYARQTDSHDRFTVFSVDHGLRPEAADEVAFVVREAQQRGFAARGLAWTGRKPKTGVQAAARAARYGLFAEAMKADGTEVLVTAHHLGDQAETVLMRLAHGSGVEGLRGMDMFSQVGDILIARPLLSVDPEVLHEVVAGSGLRPVMDPGNTDLDYERVRWRQLLPQLAQAGLTAERLGKFADRMGDAETALVSMTAQALSMVVFSDAAPEASVTRDLLMSIPRAIAVRVVARVLDRVGGGQKPHALAAVEGLTDRLIREPVRATLHGCIIRSGGKTIRFTREPGREAARERRAERTQA